MKSLKAQKHQLSQTEAQLALLGDNKSIQIPSFKEKLKGCDLFPLRPTQIEVLQINLGKMCNQVCKHCHVDAGPDRKEIMSRETMEACLQALRNSDIRTVDLTGGAPEMNPHFRWFVEQLHRLGKHIIVRCNLTIIVANPKYNDLPDFFKAHGVEVVSSLPYFSARRTDSQRGEGVFEKSIRALKMLNAVGYGKEESGLILNLVYNPSGGFLPAGQEELEKQFRQKLDRGYDVAFNSLFAITNLPVSRFLDYLVQSEQYETYMRELVSAFNPQAAAGVMCRSTISVGWDGYLYDCDFNQMLDLKVATRESQHIRDFDAIALKGRNILINQHCFGCTAGAGSSCGGETV
ncbi:arsenosugar biosynthesis radical SAM (seleno)protein ArsS [Xanthovirga aplysinae]|uniref:arsenosugar biosynthesis radical SAM (seleno)protein ArsS n=1 Tax=Xanthovirga aplysinae TaxID=2529853 RepID=UPI0012BC6057|nr:arsenosugar biosynthesis radical SAM (seleno)protein ArsS [Xanthovirga aplysinae]MTI32748.1 radical SAM/Cys-rich domain protein [Xanthovirga aplysinae]